MSYAFDRLVKDLIGAMKVASSPKTSPLDTTAEVVRVEDGIAWVHLPGGIDETPVSLTMAVSPGDTVQVRINSGKAWITGNATAPPTDDKKAIEARDVADNAQTKAGIAEDTAVNAKETAEAIREDVDSYTTTISDGGIMVHPKNDSTSGWKISSAIELLKEGVTYIKAWLAGENSDVPTVQIGADDGAHIEINEDSFVLKNEDQMPMLDCRSNGTPTLTQAELYDPDGVGLGDSKQYKLVPPPTSGTTIELKAPGSYSFPAGTSFEHTGVFIITYDGNDTITIQSTTMASGVLIEYTTTTNAPIFRYGSVTDDSGGYSAALGYNLIASGDYQTVIGKYNFKDRNGDYAFIIGNGIPAARRDAFRVGWDGNTFVSGNLQANTISTSLGQLGERIMASPDAVSRASGRYFNTASVSLGPGMWLIIVAVSFSANATGIRRSYLTNDDPSDWNNTTTAPNSIAITGYNNVSAASSGNSYTHAVVTANISSGTYTYYLAAYHTAGTAINVTGRINAVRIG